MAIDPKKWTTKTQEAVAVAIDQAKAFNNPELTPDHLLAAVSRQEDTIVPAVLQQLGMTPLMLRAKADDAVSMARRPGVMSARCPLRPSRPRDGTGIRGCTDHADRLRCSASPCWQARSPAAMRQ